MPSVVKAFGEVQPITPLSHAVRGLFMGPDGEALAEHSTAYYTGLSLIWAAAIFVVFGLLAIWRFTRR
ncbi:hypothetical protein J5X84_23175 [Streptosporangiaceae bacterium NEAU-GS5]|nr:hypothetical protein [Streptosporangiaceae bacterium NEAU-GS5]